ncbi:glycosyltransferase family 2 protein [Seleniivibrio woodruffii]|uniref:Glycosyltransferase n=1 Tax=Seleniivibrio woodruffii TaxID=1078050 RepID=A0A4R1KBY9_9BACT|nr:glycosyltransferase family 2 protein [Seleniivibrio woodruffii]TCK62025.1 glycosyltransferase [Seleniivibrio woodruffii]TVZ34858.1 glycosyltransferase [Seleniivibrio woodruffii]
MKVSVITVVKNNERTIRQAIESAIGQRNVDLEYIVIDGKSTDKTLKIIKEYKSRISVLISEKDKNLYHALNKAIKLATGDIVAILHSDDVYASDHVLADVVKCFEETDCSTVYGDLAIVKHDEPDRMVRYWKSGKFSKSKLYMGWMPPHPSFFVKRELYQKYGLFDTNFRISADYDLILRIMSEEGKNSCYLPKLLVKMRAGGASNNSPKNLMKKMNDDYLVVKKHKLGGLFTVVMKKVIKMHQYIVLDNMRLWRKESVGLFGIRTLPSCTETEFTVPSRRLR